MEAAGLPAMDEGARPIGLRRIIQMNDVWATYGSGHALRGVSASIESGSNYAIVGRSGSGKSTLLRLMNGMLAPERGAVRVGYDVPDARGRRFRRTLRTIGYIPQNLGLVKNTTVLRNVLLGALPRLGAVQSALGRFPEGEVAEAERVLASVGLGGMGHRKAHALSGGERRRVAIARALMQHPTILLADEIVSELDPGTAREIMGLVSEAQRRTGLTAVMVHHDVSLALEYASRVAVISEGKKVLEIGVDGDSITDFQTGSQSTREAVEAYSRDA
ncbi:Phosphonates import ATP-binding protein PhnC [Nitrosopumilaceae archaeon]|nr:Phosphonates import ATP-binding protein PhnC [Nitrosopumilaceae archaeon]